MPRYVIEREIEGAGDLTQDQLRASAVRSLEVLGTLGSKIQWLYSYVTDNKIYCIYIAPDEETIRLHAQMAGFPVDRISRVRGLLDPSNYT